jgi:hypothetical protein
VPAILPSTLRTLFNDGKSSSTNDRRLLCDNMFKICN